MELPTLKVERLYRQISNLIIQFIQDGRFKVGEALPAERDLARQLGVGRSSVREALIALEIAGWVEIRTGTGVFVMRSEQPAEPAPPQADITSATELLEARSVIESELAALAAVRGSTDQIVALGQLVDDMAAEREENAAFHAHDQRFHFLIAEMTGNDVLQQTAEQLWNKRYTPLFQQLETHYGVAEWADQVVAEHRAVYEAIAARDAGAARAAMVEHLSRVAEKLFRQS
ncbi:FadR/GntR family transcriptional regulator [Silvimonas soli]|uniref:FadR/GntR family transcriptional regulator n=1 Tax=Silvimonas soli TaxID=2980100 RepID=UPI0024B34C7F|nr:FadR/GntR family transcriptional regulator [Silvimonas soli]